MERIFKIYNCLYFEFCIKNLIYLNICTIEILLIICIHTGLIVTSGTLTLYSNSANPEDHSLKFGCEVLSRLNIFKYLGILKPFWL